MLVVPLLPKRGAYSILPARGGRPVTGLFAQVLLQLVESTLPTMPHPFLIDTGAACSGMSLAKATRLGLLRSSDRIIELRVGTASQEPTVQPVRIGRLTAKLALLRPQPFEWPVIFHTDWPDTRPLLLGLAGVVDDLTIHVDGTPNEMSEFGSVALSLRIPPA